MTNPEQKTATWIKWVIGVTLTIASLLVGIAAIYMPLEQSSNQFDEQQRVQKSQFDELNRIQQLLFDEERKEDVAISITPNLGTYVKITKHKVLQMPWIIEIVNNGQVTTSITRWTVSKGADSGSTFFTDILGNTKFLDNSPIALPVKIESGEVITFTADIGFLMPDKMMDILREEFGIGEITHKQALIHLRDNQLDLVGQELRWTNDEGWKDNEGNRTTWHMYEPNKSDFYKFSVQTGRNGRFSALCRQYGILAFMPMPQRCTNLPIPIN